MPFREDCLLKMTKKCAMLTEKVLENKTLETILTKNNC